MLVQIAVSGSPLLETYTYRSDFSLELGERVEVNFAGRNVIGYVTSLEGSEGTYKIKNVIKSVDEGTFLSGADLALADYSIKHFLGAPGKVFDLFFPPGKLLKLNDFVVPLSQDLGLALASPKDKVIKEYGRETLEKWLAARDVKLMHSFDQARPKKRKVRRVRLNRELGDLREDLNPLWQSIVDYLFSVDSEELTVLEKKLGLKSRSPIDTLIKRGVLSSEETQESDSKWVIPSVEALTPEQREASDRLLKATDRPSLLYGLTGTGKTEVYFKVMEYWLNRGKQVLYLVPEVSLTPQLLARVRGAFPGRDIRQYHSYMARGQRQRVWLDAVQGNADIVVGTRSALWLPLKKTGLLILDEEHDSSFYQQSAPYYDGVEVAIKKGEFLNVPVILGSATPRVTHFSMAKSGKFNLLELRNRPVGSFPKIEIIDMKEEKKPVISEKALVEIESTLKSGKQVFVFVHRKGFSNYVVCHTCGNTVTCPHCSVSLTYHRVDNLLKCHYCGYKGYVPSSCPQCGSMTLSARGFGTERVEHDLQKHFPSAIVMRMDRETIDNPASYERALLEIANKNCQIIVGTKMITKGLDFPHVETVLVIDADRLMSFPSYDSLESAFQHISQVSGRSGRAGTGKAFIQTFKPDNRIIRRAFQRDYDAFYSEEIALREKLLYPPFVKLVEIICLSNSEEGSRLLAQKTIEKIKRSTGNYLELFGPLVPSLSKIKNTHRTKLVIKLPPTGNLDFLEEIAKKHPTELQIIVDNIGGTL